MPSMDHRYPTYRAGDSARRPSPAVLFTRPPRRRSLLRKLLQSRTVWVAIGQALVGGIAAAVAANPTLANIGWIAIAKSVLDVFLRAITTQPVGKGQP